ncbi:hypothetical protein INH39_13290 [Massilia violaceinigra]|uniref:Uncharacterized protein n=1 Tax=Massilia violaceinigra TaxID=2045208 RepID=A0ABY4AEF7_9BURK|nr:hypothetical protein [Massilia violaceinigra]UOD32535.1 hypothetical protein INH39_13290 [Massilia violaceinigra]
MPLYARLAQYVLFAVLAYLAAWSGWTFVADTHNVIMLVFFIWLCATIVGLYRRVAWGRFYVSCLSVMAALLLALSTIPLYQPTVRDTLLHQMLMLPLWGAWLCIVTLAILILTPAFLIGIRQDWFRSAWW